MTDWKFTKRGEQCAQCSRPFAEGEVHVSALAVEGETIARLDACLACWKRRDAQNDLFWWRTHHSANKPRGLALNLEALEALFFSLGARSETNLRELRYVLCLILMRKRRLKIDRVGRSERGEVLVVSRPRRQEAHEVDVYDFSPEKIDELRGRLQDVFEQSDVSVPEGETSGAVEPRSDAEARVVGERAATEATEAAPAAN
jgi:hypothetical protein